LHQCYGVERHGHAQRLGKLGETLAAAELQRRGYAVSAMNFRTRFGEIDIVCERGDTVVFVEVKARRTAARGTAAESIPIWKRRRIGAMAIDYLAQSGRHHRRIRFDVVAIDRAGTANQTIRVIENAFAPGSWH
jgi:putative endonuclease